jgi:hypothetical protein
MIRALRVAGEYDGHCRHHQHYHMLFTNNQYAIPVVFRNRKMWSTISL